MPTIGSYTYPNTGIEEAIDMARKVATTLGGEDFDRGSLAAALGYQNPTSGSFNNRMADLKRYGILEGRGSSIRITELAHKLAAPGPGEFSQAVGELVMNIPLFKALYDRFGNRLLSQDEIYPVLMNVTKADRIEIQKQIGDIRKLYAEGISRMGESQPTSEVVPDGPSVVPQMPPVQRADVLPPEASSQALREFHAPGGQKLKVFTQGEVRIQVPDDVDALEEASEIIEVWLNRARKRSETEGKD